MISFKVTQSFYNEILEEAEKEGHNSVSDYIKFAIRFYMMECKDNRRPSEPDAKEKATAANPTISQHS